MTTFSKYYMTFIHLSPLADPFSQSDLQICEIVKKGLCILLKGANSDSSMMLGFELSTFHSGAK